MYRAIDFVVGRCCQSFGVRHQHQLLALALALAVITSWWANDDVELLPFQRPTRQHANAARVAGAFEVFVTQQFSKLQWTTLKFLHVAEFSGCGAATDQQ